MRTHYDNLNVAETAPDEVIRAAYKALAMKFHPDRNDGNAELRRTMQIINEAYAVLSVPVGRREYDRLLLLSRQTQPVQQNSFKQRQPVAMAKPVKKPANILVALLTLIFSNFRISFRRSDLENRSLITS